jgi:hypothetical protein
MFPVTGPILIICATETIFLSTLQLIPANKLPKRNSQPSLWPGAVDDPIPSGRRYMAAKPLEAVYS